MRRLVRKGEDGCHGQLHKEIGRFLPKSGAVGQQLNSKSIHGSSYNGRAEGVYWPGTRQTGLWLRVKRALVRKSDWVIDRPLEVLRQDSPSVYAQVVSE